MGTGETMKNIVLDDRKAFFIDLDGTLVFHNYDPENIDDEYLPGVIDYLFSIKDQYLVLTTARSYTHTYKILDELSETFGIHFSKVLCDLPIGERYLINDYKGTTIKAFSINVKRNKGLECLNQQS